MYTGANLSGTYLGTVGYGHLNNRIANQTVNFNYQGSTDRTDLYIGTIPDFPPSGDCHPNPTIGSSCTCYRDNHVHLQAGQGSSSITVTQTSLAACQGISVNSTTPIYYFNW